MLRILVPRAFDHFTMVWMRPDFTPQSHIAQTPLRINLPQEGQRMTLSSTDISTNTLQFWQKYRISPESIKLFFLSQWLLHLALCCCVSLRRNRRQPGKVMSPL